MTGERRTLVRHTPRSNVSCKQGELGISHGAGHRQSLEEDDNLDARAHPHPLKLFSVVCDDQWCNERSMQGRAYLPPTCKPDPKASLTLPPARYCGHSRTFKILEAGARAWNTDLYRKMYNFNFQLAAPQWACGETIRYWASQRRVCTEGSAGCFFVKYFRQLCRHTHPRCFLITLIKE